jgi:sialidase-1
VKNGYAKNRLLFSNASSVTGRRNLAVRISYDEGKTWSEGKVIEEGFSAYSSLSILKDGSIGILYEPGHDSVRFARFTLEELTDGKDSLSKPYEIR